ncbi:MAG: AAA family ATPase, partial [Defluviitaleaceae bacterium]|nr:AAA family ATPase [Defluviitaleaceae bacterium]
MDLSITMRMVMVRAQAETHGTGLREVYPEHIFMGILKLPELSIEDSLSEINAKEEIKADIENVEELLKQYSIKTSEGRLHLRRALKTSPPDGDAKEAVNDLLAEASRAASGEYIWVFDILKVILQKPSPMIKSLFLAPSDFPADNEFGRNKAHKSQSIQDNEDIIPVALDKQVAAESLAKLSGRVRNMQFSLLKLVRGQDHAVRAFADGIFNAEILADTDTNRVQPKATFLFAGPPGVGKTFLAQEAAKSLGLPFRRFDMSNFSDHQAHSNLIGFNAAYRAAKPGMLSGFVQDNPNCILLFDEIEKAHLNTIQLFLQILDAGNLHDDFLDKSVSFKESVIIFTTNAGKQLYAERKAGAARVARHTILESLGTDIDPRTQSPYFPAAICSRLAQGYPILFNHLQSHDLEAIVQTEFERMADLFHRKYDVEILMDSKVAPIMLFSEGGLVDARTLRAQTELFFKNEMFKLCRLWGQDNFAEAFAKIDKIHFEVEDNFSADIKPLFQNPDNPKILLFGSGTDSEEIAERLRKMLPTYTILSTQDIDTALKTAGEEDLLFVLLEISVGSVSGINTEQKDIGGTIALFEHVPISSHNLRPINEMLGAISERLPDLPVFLLDNLSPGIDEELEMAYSQKGVRGTIILPVDSLGDFGVFTDEIERISTQVY